MPDFTLPSGRIIQTHEPTYGELIHIVSEGGGNIETLLYAKFALIIPGLTREEVSELTREDGFALQEEMTRIWDGRPEAEEIPLGAGLMLSFEASSQKITLRPPTDLPSTEWLVWRDALIGRLSNWQPPESKPVSSANDSDGALYLATAG